MLVTMDTLEQIQSHQALLSLGKKASLMQYVDVLCINQIISDFEKYFVYYNPRKKGYNRYGLSLTSKDGGLSGVPDLDSLIEYNKEHGTDFNESDFRKWTPLLKACKALQEAMSPFNKYMARSHVLRLNRGGFFPFHRDGYGFNAKTFRLIISLCRSENQYVFLLDNENFFFSPGRLYFINTQLAHCIFSFEDRSDFVVFNIDFCRESVQTLINNLEVK